MDWKTRQHKSKATKPRTGEEKVAILRQILDLCSRQLETFRPTQPPSAIRAFIRRATLGQLQGTLVELLAAMLNK